MMKRLGMKKFLCTYGAGIATGAVLAKFFFAWVLLGLVVVGGGFVAWKLLGFAFRSKGRY